MTIGKRKLVTEDDFKTPHILACHIDFPQYLFRSDGAVISLVFKRQWFVSPGLKGTYRGMTLLNRSGKLQNIYLHRVICEVFRGVAPAGEECRHRDGNKEHNYADNLIWGTRSQNMRDKELHGTAPIGERHNMAKLTDQDVREIRLLAECGAPPWLPMRHYNISRMQHWRIVNRKNWTHI